MFSLSNQYELRKITVSSLMTCIYLSSLIAVISYNGLLYSIGKGSSFYILVLIFVAELLKSTYLSFNNDDQTKKTKSSKNRISEFMKSFVFLLGVMFSFFTGILLFGAPVMECHEETLVLSSLLTLLTMYPLIAHSGVESSMQLLFGVKSYTKDSIMEMLVNNAILSVCGAWLGAVVIPLDWNTPWQQWPIPCYLGALAGYLVSNVLTVFKVALINAAYKYPALNFVVNILHKIHFSK